MSSFISQRTVTRKQAYNKRSAQQNRQWLHYTPRMDLISRIDHFSQASLTKRSYPLSSRITRSAYQRTRGPTNHPGSPTNHPPYHPVKLLTWRTFWNDHPFVFFGFSWRMMCSARLITNRLKGSVKHPHKLSSLRVWGVKEQTDQQTEQSHHSARCNRSA